MFFFNWSAHQTFLVMSQQHIFSIVHFLFTFSYNKFYVKEQVAYNNL